MKTQKIFKNFISKAIETYQYDVSPNFISIELILRELITLAEYQKDLKLFDFNFVDELILLNRKSIDNCNPFEVIDGDLLDMQVNFLKNVFKVFQ